MKILLINTVCGTGSTGRITVEYYNKYKSENNDVKVIYGRGFNVGVPKGDAFCFNNKLDFYYHCLLSRITDSHGLHSKSATLKMIAFIKAFKPDMIHLHNIHGYYLNFKMLFEYLNSTDIKILWTLHDCWTFTGHCSHYLYNKCNKWQTACTQCKHYKEYPTSWFFDKSYRNILLKKKLFTDNNNLSIITPSKWLAEEVKKSFLKNLSVEVVNNKIDLEIFKPTDSDIKLKLGIGESKKVILGVACPWSNRKGFTDFIELAKAIDNEIYQIVMVGLNKKQIGLLPNNIIGIKSTNSKAELAKIYTMADIFFNPTYEDNYPTVTLEAKACGCKVICFANTGGGEEIIDEKDILLKSRNIKNVLSCL